MRTLYRVAPNGLRNESSLFALSPVQPESCYICSFYQHFLFIISSLIGSDQYPGWCGVGLLSRIILVTFLLAIGCPQF